MARLRPKSRAAIVASLTLAMAACGGYGVEGLGNSADVRLDQMQDQDQITFAELVEVENCDRVTVVGAYTSDAEKKALIGNADVDLASQDQFVVVVAFDDEEVLRAVRLSRTPVDLDWLAPRTLPCESTITSEAGRAVLRGS